MTERITNGHQDGITPGPKVADHVDVIQEAIKRGDSVRIESVVDQLRTGSFDPFDRNNVEHPEPKTGLWQIDIA